MLKRKKGTFYNKGYGTPKNWYGLVSRVGQRDDVCYICKKRILPGESYQTHHIQPLSKGGTNTAINNRKIHTACHVGKHWHMR